MQKEEDEYRNSLARYAEVNAEVGQPREGEKRVVFLGSSSFDIWNLAADFPGLPLLNRGIGGESTHQFWLRWWPDVAALKPFGMILFPGSLNDMWPDKRMSLEETRANIARIARMAQSRGIKVALGTISPVNDYLPGKTEALATHPIEQVQALNRWIEELCHRQGYEFVDFYTAVADSSGKLRQEFSSDGMHCNAAGYAAWKPLVEDLFKKWQVIP